MSSILQTYLMSSTFDKFQLTDEGRKGRGGKGKDHCMLGLGLNILDLISC